MLKFTPNGPIINKNGEYSLAKQMEQAFSNHFKALPKTPLDFNLLRNSDVASESSKRFFEIQDTTEGRKFEKVIYDALSGKQNN